MYASRGFVGRIGVVRDDRDPGVQRLLHRRVERVRSTSETAIPLTPALTALLSALTISETLLVCEPVHWYEQPSSLQASDAPLCVGVKNGFVVTWLTNVNL